MSLKDKAKQLRSEAEATRGIYQPAVDSKSYRIYRWWQQESGSSRSKEDFCHFYRVVLIWAPLRLVGRFLERRVLLPLWAWLGIFSVALFCTVLHILNGYTWLSMLVGTIAIVGGFAILIMNLFWLQVCTERALDKKWGEFYQESPGTFYLFLPVAGILTGVLALIYLPAAWLHKLIELGDKKGVFKKVWAWMRGKRGPKFLRPGAILGYALLTALIVLSFFFTLALEILSGIAFFVGIATILTFVLVIGSIFHDMYQKRVLELSQKEGISEEEAMARYKKSRIHSRIWRSFTSFSHLVWQLILTAKWKICPIIKFPDGS